MPRWVLDCPECNAKFTHTELIATESVPANDVLRVAPKPEFPEGGLELECPNCKVMSAFQRRELIFVS
jgi:hypothetical protein